MAPWQDVLDQVVRDRRAALVAYAYLFVADRGDAEDLVQEALVRTFARPRAMTDVHAAEAYVRRAIRTSFLDRARRHRLWLRKAHLVVGDGTVRGPADAAAAHADVMVAMRMLTRRERACIVLRYFDDLTVPDVAAELGLSDGSVKRYLSDATRKLRDLLGSTVTWPPAEVHTLPVSSASGRSTR
ncbi:sigma-70 family RNA polymerase sigma factor [Actinotalea sp. K2]|uniref:sigma-70 family RNA polymerase sigma factor n=1 Tax=Actinotalea sp. K2 TaxID=2939438 RepID=UPI002018159A|nr:sigma-70 family RNA polymerase sigma factor [Actinotalea sp. K2]MCL3863135.1 sigma-70 family RNA polymerase sigma factor [Actinotalea sp. K2]